MTEFDRKVERTMRSVAQIARAAAGYASDDVGGSALRGLAQAAEAIGVVGGFALGVAERAAAGDAARGLGRDLAKLAELKAKAVETLEAAVPEARRNPLGANGTLQLSHVDDQIAALRQDLGLA